MASQFAVVHIPDDDVPTAAASPPSSRKRSHGAAAASSPPPSPPLSKRLLLAASASAIDLDTPSPPRRRPSSAPKLPILVDDDDDDTDPSAVPCSLDLRDDAVETPDSVLLRSQTPELDEPRSTGPGIVVAENPGFTSPRSVRQPPAARGLSSAAPAQKLSAGDSSVISLDSDDESDDAMHRQSVTKLPSSTAGQNDGATSYGQPLHADLTCEVSTLPGADDCTEGYSSREAKKRQKEENKKKQQEEKRLKKEEKAKQIEEGKQKRQENKMQKEAMKAQLADKKKKDKEILKWESGKLALKCITAEIDNSVAQIGSIGGPLLSSLAEKGLSYELTKNSIGRSILWKMEVPQDIAQALSSLNDGCDMNQASVSEVPYIVIVLQAEEFCDLVSRGSFFDHVQKVREEYPTFTICYLTNKLMYHINKRDQSEFKNKTTWSRPPVEEVLCKLATHYVNVHSRQCIDEAEVAEHLVGLTSSLAKCKFRKPLTWLSVHANGSVIPESFIDKGLAKKDTWLKSLIAIPGIQPRYALAIWKKYRSMRSLLNVYMDPSKTVLEKELWLSDLKWEDRLGNVAKRLGQKCSRRVYIILMAENGDLETDTAEAGA